MTRLSSALVVACLVVAFAQTALGQIPRFSPSELAEDGATLGVFDSSTDRDWLFTAEPVDSWADALDHCESLEFAGKDDWHVPTIQELASLADTSTYNDVRYADFFDTNNFLLPLLSSTTDAQHRNHIFFVNFAMRPPGIVETRDKSLSGLAWCVRTR